jgi:NADH:ubiquinone oxidoreductase subunit 4 (subunit M)
MLAWTVYISFIGVLVLMLLPKDNAAAARKVAMTTAVAGLFVALTGFFSFPKGEIPPLPSCLGCRHSGWNFIWRRMASV